MSRRPALASALLLMAACAGAGNPGSQPAPADGVKLYIVNQNGASVAVVDQQALTVDTVIDLTALGFSATAKPHHVAVEPDGSAWYISLIGDGRVLKFGRDNRLLGQVEMETPGLLALDHGHDSLYVGRSMTAVNPPKSLGVIRRSQFELIDEQETVIARPHALVASPDGEWVHTASLAENRIASVEVATGRVTISSIEGAPRSLVQFTVGPDGRHMITGGELSNTVLVYDLEAGPPLKPVREFRVGGKPWDGVFSPDGSKAYFSLLADNAVVEIDWQAGKVLRTFTERMAQPDGMIMRADGRYLFVANRNTGDAAPGQSGHDMHGMEGHDSSDGWLAVVDVATGRTITTLMLGASPTGMGAAGAR